MDIKKFLREVPIIPPATRPYSGSEGNEAVTCFGKLKNKVLRAQGRYEHFYACCGAGAYMVPALFTYTITPPLRADDTLSWTVTESERGGGAHLMGKYLTLAEIKDAVPDIPTFTGIPEEEWTREMIDAYGFLMRLQLIVTDMMRYTKGSVIGADKPNGHIDKLFNYLDMALHGGRRVNEVTLTRDWALPVYYYPSLVEHLRRDFSASQGNSVHRNQRDASVRHWVGKRHKLQHRTLTLRKTEPFKNPNNAGRLLHWYPATLDYVRASEPKPPAKFALSSAAMGEVKKMKKANYVVNI